MQSPGPSGQLLLFFKYFYLTKECQDLFFFREGRGNQAEGNGKQNIFSYFPNFINFLNRFVNSFLFTD